MLLKNFGALLATAFTNAILQEGVKCTTGEFPANDSLKRLPQNQNSISQILTTATYEANRGGSGNGTFTIGFGDGTTPPTIDDYKFSGSLVTAALGVNRGTISVGCNGTTFQVVVMNKTESAMTIKEIGLFMQVSGSGCVMLTRDVLPEPVVLEIGASKGFEIFIDTQSFIANASQV